MTDPKNPFEGSNPFAAMFAQAQEMAKTFPALEAFTPEGVREDDGRPCRKT